MLRFYQLDLAADFEAKSSLWYLPIPVTLLRYLLIAVLFIITVKFKSNQSIIIFILLLTGVLITPISRLVIGQDLETFHYLRRAIMPIATISFFIIIYHIALIRRFISTISILILIIALQVGVRTQVIASEKVQKAHSKNYAQEKLFDWLATNTPKASVIGSLNMTLSSIIPVYTNNKIYFPPTDRTITPTYEGVERYSILANLLGITPDWQKKNLDNTISYMFIYQAYTPGIGLDFNSPRRIKAEADIDRLSSGIWRNHLTRYQLDYVIVTSEEFPQISPNLDLLFPIASIDQYIIFQYQK